MMTALTIMRTPMNKFKPFRLNLSIKLIRKNKTASPKTPQDINDSTTTARNDS